MDSDLAWVNGKSGRQSWRYADAFQRSIISEAIYHLPFYPDEACNIDIAIPSVSMLQYRIVSEIAKHTIEFISPSNSYVILVF